LRTRPGPEPDQAKWNLLLEVGWILGEEGIPLTKTRTGPLAACLAVVWYEAIDELEPSDLKRWLTEVCDRLRDIFPEKPDASCP
jgi:hypothetical protein